MHVHTHTHNTLTPYSATWPQNGFPFTGSLHFKMENAQETKQVANQTPMQFGHTVCSIFPSQVTNCTKWGTSSFPLFSGAHHYSGSKGQTNTRRPRDSYAPPQKRRCPEASLKCLYTNLHRLDDKQGELQVHRELQGWEPAWNHREIVGYGWGMVTDGYSWSRKGWRGRRVTLHIIEFLDCIKCQHGIKSLPIDNF